MNVFILVLFIITFVAILGFIAAISTDFDQIAENRKKADDYYKLNYKTVSRALDSTSYTKVTKRLEELEAGYNEIKDLGPKYVADISHKCYQDDLRDVRNHADGLNHESWYEKASNLLDKIIEQYDLIMECSFSDVEQAHSAKNQLLRNYDKYWEVTQTYAEKSISYAGRDKIWKDAKSEMALFLKEEGFTSWDSPEFGRNSIREQLNKRISERLDMMRPEYIRKTTIMKNILAFVNQEDMVMRSQLLKMDLGANSLKETEACYRALVNTKKLIEFKIENRHYVALSDKEAVKKKYLSTPVAKPVSSKSESSISLNAKQESSAMMDAISEIELVRSFLAMRSLEYIDKTSSGGGLYFFDEKAADEIKAKGIKLAYAANGSRSTGYRPAWYIKDYQP